MTAPVTEPVTFHQIPIFRLLKKGHFEEVEFMFAGFASHWGMLTPSNIPPLSDGERAALLAQVRTHGEPATVRRLGIPRQTLARALANLTLRAGSVLLIRNALANAAKAKAA